MTKPRRLALGPRALAALTLAGLAAGCAETGTDWDLRTNASSTAQAALSVAGERPAPDANGVISYTGYQVVVAQAGDTVTSLADRLGIDAASLAAYNALQPGDSLRAGEVLALPTRVEPAGPGAGGISTVPLTPGAIDVTSIAGGAIDSASPGAATLPFQAAAPGPEPLRHQVQRGETAFTIARLYNVSPKDLADWNGLDADYTVREGQYLLIPTIASAPSAQESAPGQGTATPSPPSAAEPLPADETATASEVAESLPASPEMAEERTEASAALFVMPVAGTIIRAYEKDKSEGIDIAAPAGTPVKAADTGTVAAVTQDTEGTPILVLRHADNLLTVYAGIEGLTVAKGDAVQRGQVLGTVRPGDPAFLHFEVRQGIDSVDPMPYLQ